jgi:acetyl-CoA acetyltransferase
MSGRDVAVVGAGMIRFGKYPDASYPDLAQPAVVDAMRSAGIEPHEIDATYCGHSFGGMLTGQRILKGLGMTGEAIVNVENACSSGAGAFHQAHAAIASGEIETALVIGVDKLTQFAGGTLPLNVEDHEVASGMVMPALYAMRAQRYLHDYGYDADDLARVSVKARANGALNPFAQFRKPVTLEEVRASRPIAEPLNLFQCCPTGDGGAAVVLMSAERVRRSDATPVWVIASVLHSGRYMTGFRDFTLPEITVRSAKDAYEQAAIDPGDLDFAEVHDAFTIAELLYYEALQLCERGEAPRLVVDGVTALGGRVPVNPSGGLLAKGHPIGATGVGQLAEAYWQLTGRCGDRQVAGARVGLTHVTGGGIAGFDHGACAITILAA